MSATRSRPLLPRLVPPLGNAVGRGDGTPALAARYHAPLVVFTGATLALWSVVAIVVFFGTWARRALRPEPTKRAAAVVFAVVGGVLMIR